MNVNNDLKEKVENLKKEYNLSASEALPIAVQMQRNEILMAGFYVDPFAESHTESANKVSYLEAIAIVLGFDPKSFIKSSILSELQEMNS